MKISDPLKQSNTDTFKHLFSQTTSKRVCFIVPLKVTENCVT